MPNLEDTFNNLFRRNEYLTSIDLSSNGLTYLPDETFHNNQNLTDIRLSHNSFTQLPLNASTLKKLKLLDLQYNEIRYLDDNSRQKVELIYHTANLRLGQDNVIPRVLLEGNPFTCKCEALSFLQWFVASPIFNSTYTCDLDDRTIPMTELAVHEASDDCERPMRRRRTIALSTVLPAVAIAMIVAMVIFLKRRYKRRLEQRQLDDTLQLIREEDTGFPYTVFLAYSSIDRDFVIKQIREPMEKYLQKLTRVHKEHIADDNTLTPGHPTMQECQTLIAESAVFIAVVSAHFCQSFYCNAELTEAQDRGKPTILIFKEYVDESTMGMALKAVFLTNVRAKIEQDGNSYKMIPNWDRLCKAIIKLVNRKQETP